MSWISSQFYSPHQMVSICGMWNQKGKMNEKLCSFPNSLVCTSLVHLEWRFKSAKKIHSPTQYHTVVPFYEKQENGEALIGMSSKPGSFQVIFLWGFLCVKGWSWNKKKQSLGSFLLHHSVILKFWALCFNGTEDKVNGMYDGYAWSVAQYATDIDAT